MSETTEPKRRQIGTPNNIEVLLHYHTSPCPHDRHDAREVSEARAMLLAMGAIEPDDKEKCYRTTEMGKAWVGALCMVGIPQPVYIDEKGNIFGKL